MTKFIIENVSKENNAGNRAEQNIDFYFNGKMRKISNKRFDIESDIPELNMSVKSAHFTLASASLLKGDTLDEKLDEFFERVHSTSFIYVCADEITAFQMSKDEFYHFCKTFCKLECDGVKNGKGVKVRCNHESSKTRFYLFNMCD